jgi:hypothetical protein
VAGRTKVSRLPLILSVSGLPLSVVSPSHLMPNESMATWCDSGFGAGLGKPGPQMVQEDRNIVHIPGIVITFMQAIGETFLGRLANLCV